MGKDIFEVMRDHIGCTYISDLPYHRKSVWYKLKMIDIEDYPSEQVEDFSIYVFGIEYGVLKEMLSKYTSRKMQTLKSKACLTRKMEKPDAENLYQCYSNNETEKYCR